MQLQEILKKYWGYDAFRPLQEDIIRSVMEGKDTLALLPTGGGKSVCFQVPALAMDGFCLVVSPLIALMKDQVQHLKDRGISAYAVYSGLTRNEVEVAYNNCSYGKAKFLYVSPERLESDDFLIRLPGWKINLLAVDEAHCISQWGYDFRPPYLRIADLRSQLEGVPVLALTATATPRVVDDIQEKLAFRSPHLLQKSFYRKNLAYMVLREEDKRSRLLNIINKTGGTGIIYTRNRKKTQEFATWLVKNGIKATSYHAGLDMKTRSQRQEDWMKGRVSVMVATNAFGMGIDKPDVRYVVHVDLPDNLEAYFQEAGRAGRDGKKSYSIILFENHDIENLKEMFAKSYPEPEVIRTIYACLGNYGRIPVEQGANTAIDFDLSDFCRQYRLNALTVFNVLQFLEREGHVLLSDNFDEPSVVRIRTDREDLYHFQISHENYDEFIKLLLRSYGGLFQDYVPVWESELAKRMDWMVQDVKKALGDLQTMGVLDYIPRKTMPQLVFCRDRMNEKYLPINNATYHHRKNLAATRLESVTNYVEGNAECRSVSLLKYFGEKQIDDCGVCDVCLDRRKFGRKEKELELLKTRILEIVKHEKVSLPELLDRFGLTEAKKAGEVVRWLMDNGWLVADDKGFLINHDQGKQ